ncbi:MFS transporter [Novosphingobium piscinae]|uniref:MFS transporter n=1 Tax=Novosphingobium piscinae TaxID=1507448 RepID=A0A7X1FVD8_9SPHN|nr:MFS transporter [Novosphingobium piscinae]MBC2667686.1 MFS transporter [Novosphingobium piscinae]
MGETRPGAMAEWRSHCMLPLAAACGYATSVIHIYGLGPYIQPIAATFGWSRTQVTVGVTLATLVQALLSVPVGLAVDRFGPRALGVGGVVLSAAAFAGIGTATGSPANWYLLWLLMALATLPVQATVWTSAVASRFTASRGLAFAVTLCGASVAQALFPYLGARLIAAVGWQRAMAWQAGLWIALAFPLIWLFFRGAHDRPRGGGARQAASAAPLQTGLTFAEGLRSSVYARLFLTCLMLTFGMVALSIHFVPVLTARGATATAAAGIASLIGLSSIVGRLGTGVLIDRYPARLVGGGVFLLPALGTVVLLFSGASGLGPMVAAAVIGLTLGAEIDVIVYILTRYFGLRAFGALYGALLIALSLGTALGPLAAARVFDLTGRYDLFLWSTVGLMLASSVALLSLPREPAAD